MDKIKEFIERSKKIHGNKYDYSLVKYKNLETKVKIICPKHGEFEQKPKYHLTGSKCPKCGKTSGLTTEEFIKKAKKVHGDKYDYSLVKYKNMRTNVKIICPDHGQFNQLPKSHLKGHDCSICSGNKKYSTNEFIKRAKEIHGDKYDYSLVNYLNHKTKIKIICPKHGIFYQTPSCHLEGKACPKCGNRYQKNTDWFISESKKIHNNKYSYILTHYNSPRTNIKIICPKHGLFEQTPENHLLGYGCEKCGYENNILTTEEFIKRAKKIHGDKYNYIKTEYRGNKIKLKIICLIHGIFYQTPSVHLEGKGCPKCANVGPSKPEIEINNFIKSLGINTIISDRTIISPYELDIYIPDKNIAIEFNGLYYHSEQFKNKKYHLNKTIECENKGVQLIHIFEDEWVYKKDIVKSRLKNILGLTKDKIYARKTIVKEINTKLAKNFMDNNHLQGYTNSSIKLGLFYNNELVSVMLFNKPRIGIGSEYNGYELSRFANILNTNIIGGASKLLKYFERNYKPKEIRSYADKRWSTGGLYNSLKFNLSHINTPNYWYILNDERKHRFNFRKHKLKDDGFNIKNKTEHQIMLERGIFRIYDCGTLSYYKKYE